MRLEIPAQLGGQPLAGQPGQALEEGHGLVQVGVHQPAGAVAEADALHRLLEALVIDELGAVAAEVPDRRRGGRDEQHAVERRPDDAHLVDRHGVGGHAVHLERLHLAAETAREPIDDAHRPRRIWSLHGERDLGDDEAGPDVEGGLAFEELEDVGELDPELLLDGRQESAEGVLRPKQFRQLGRAVEGDGDDRAVGDAPEERGLVGRHLGAVRPHRAGDTQAVVGGLDG